jgi:peroxiredoxin
MKSSAELFKIQNLLGETMKNLFLNVLFLLVAPFVANVAFGQTSQPSSSVIIDSKAPEKKSETPEIVGLNGQKAPAFTAAAINGTAYSLESLRGKVVVINLWGTFCPPCIEEMPKLNAIVDKFKGKDVVFLAAAADGKSVLEGFLLKNSFKYQVLPDAFGIIERYAPKKKNPAPTDEAGDFLMLLPAHLVIDQEGIVVNHFWGFRTTTADDLSKTIEQLLAKKAK